MKLTLNQTLISLYVLTIFTALAAHYAYGLKIFVSLILGLSAVKFLLVFYRYMEMYKAHPFWKWFTVIFLLMFIGTVSLIVQ